MSLFKELKTKKRSFLAAKTGKEFENRIEEQLRNDGYTAMYKSTIISTIGDNWKQFKDSILNDGDKSNKFFKEGTYIREPFGSQSYPDFLVIKNNKMIPIEIKFSREKAAKPMWNSGIPRAGGIYIFGSFSYKNKGDITFFQGSSIVSSGLRTDLIKLFKKYEDKLYNEAKALYSVEELNRGGFTPYLRKAFDQKKVHEKSVTNFFDNDDRKSFEEKVITHWSN